MNRALLTFGLILWAGMAHAREQVLVAVAANYTNVINALEDDFEASYEADLLVTVGSTGQLYAQIRAGAPFAMFLAADQARPALLEDQGLTQERFTYARGRLVAWAPTGADGPEVLRGDGFIAIANPDLAPYGAAAVEALEALGVETQGRLAMGQNIGQAYAMVATGNAQVGLVAQSAVIGQGGWLVPQELHAPILQDAVVLNGAGPGAVAFAEYLKTKAAGAIMAQFGYAGGDDG